MGAGGAGTPGTSGGGGVKNPCPPGKPCGKVTPHFRQKAACAGFSVPQPGQNMKSFLRKNEAARLSPCRGPQARDVYGPRPYKAQSRAMLRTIMTTAVVQATAFSKRELTWVPMSSGLLMSRSMNSRTKGNRMPFSTWEKIVTLSNGNPGHRMTPAPP